MRFRRLSFPVLKRCWCGAHAALLAARTGKSKSGYDDDMDDDGVDAPALQPLQVQARTEVPPTQKPRTPSPPPPAGLCSVSEPPACPPPLAAGPAPRDGETGGGEAHLPRVPEEARGTLCTQLSHGIDIWKDAH